MMYYRAEENESERQLLTDYIAIRLATEYILLSTTKEQYNVSNIYHYKDVDLVIALMFYGHLSLEEWDQLSKEDKIR
ncbi:hypothetical protein, partial [Staphylococcus epidermidis]